MQQGLNETIRILISDSKLAFMQGRYEESLRLARQALDIDRKNPDAHQCAGNAFMSREDYESAIKHYKKADYVSKDYYDKSPVIKEAVDFIVSRQALKVGHKENLERLYKELLNKDWFMTLLDLEDYIRTKDQAFADYEDQQKWKKMMLVNIAKAGFFSSDRTIAEYNRDIWKLR